MRRNALERADGNPRASKAGQRRRRTRRLPNDESIAWFRRRLLEWYGQNARDLVWRSSSSAYMQVVSEVLLQRTRAEVVNAALPAFIERFPNWHTLATARISDLQRILRPLGLWKRRAISLKSMSAAHLASDEAWPTTRAGLEVLPGVGQYVASAILLFVHRRPEPLLDVNMARVLERAFGSRTMADIRYDPWLQELSRRIVRSRRAALVNWAVLDLAAAICKPRSPRCESCPMRSRCKYYAAAKAANKQ